MAVGKVSDADFEAEVLKAQGPVVVDFWAEWCGPCRMIAPALDEISGAMGDKVKIVKLNVDESPKTASKYGVMSIPTLMIFRDRVLLFRTAGGELKALTAKCTHLDCTVQYREARSDIWCACHNGTYDTKGMNVSGPPPRPLKSLEVKVRGEKITLKLA